MLKILYFDDTAYWRKTYEEAFRKVGIAIKTLPDARGDIVKEISDFKPDLILLDISMPEINGFEAIKIMKGNEGIKNIPVFFFSNINDSSYINKGLTLGAEMYLVKGDYQPDEVIKIVIDYVLSK